MKTFAKNISRVVGAAAMMGLASMTLVAAENPTYSVRHLASEQNIISVKDASKFLLLPVQDNAPEARVITVTAATCPRAGRLLCAIRHFGLRGEQCDGAGARPACRCSLLEGYETLRHI